MSTVCMFIWKVPEIGHYYAAPLSSRKCLNLETGETVPNTIILAINAAYIQKHCWYVIIFFFFFFFFTKIALYLTEGSNTTLHHSRSST